MPVLVILISVGLSALAQTLFRIGMTRPEIQGALGEGSARALLMPLLLSPYLWSGLAAYGFGMLLWLYVLSKVPVSFAYPFVALGIVMTAFSGMLLLGEHLRPLSVIGIAVIVAGIVMVAMGRAG